LSGVGVGVPKAVDTIIGHCLLRAVVASEGAEAAAVKYGAGATVSKWEAVKVLARVTPKASRVAEFIVLWAIAMREEERDALTITEYERFWKDGERQTYRLQKEFRELWPEFDTPNELARVVVKKIDERMSKKEAMRLPMTLRVSAELP